MKVRQILLSAAVVAALVAPFERALSETGPSAREYKLVLQISDNDPGKWKLALNNASNVQKDLGEENVAIEIVAYGPGIDMLTMDSTEGPRIAEAMNAGIRVVACGNTMTGRHLIADDMLPGIEYVQAGVVEIMKLQRDGYSYVRP